ncbi:type II toxin-antitoxin system RelN family antitoxin [Mastigocoleus testarum]|uniref:DUF2281 domain-containing protein n=1 Tax=Mastigocoleus testarum BC008 TaxID=371196 RepID=A0A0V7ZIA1_9CYAN|nr:hypothetical protein [Mastigocoleus testarum]KST64276.1 hypothetical protein BC008_16695 [Mastigocoleus testarum BC008]
MEAIEVKATVNEFGQLFLDKPLTLNNRSRVRVIVLVPNHYSGDEELSETVSESFRQGWYDAIVGNTIPVSQLWEGIDWEGIDWEEIHAE